MKNLIFTFLFIIATLLFTGCRGQQEANQLTTDSVSHPQTIAIMPDGRILYRITVYSDFNDSHNHYIYFFGTNDTKTVSINYNVPQGKTTVNRTIILDGKTYNLIEK